VLLLVAPILYFSVSYFYLAYWHNKYFLFNMLTHENGRLTLLNSLFYFDHFIACVPMITVFALCTAGGFALSIRIPSGAHTVRTTFMPIILLGSSVLLVLAAFVASIYTAGWQGTINYALQRIERDGIISPGGNWNQLQLSNIPISLGTIGISSTLVMWARAPSFQRKSSLIVGGVICLSVAAMLLVGISVLNWPGWQSFLNPRWLAHSIREVATYPLTGIPIALVSVVLVEHYLSGLDTWTVKLRWPSLILIIIAIGLIVGELILLRNMDVLAIAQRPSFAPNGLSIPYLLCSHVFEHFLDFILISPLTGGIYALVRPLALKLSPGWL
jgi:hypothetical protein